MSQLNKILYVGKDYDTFYDDIINRLSTTFGSVINNASHTDPLRIITDLVSYALHSMSWYLDRQTNESYLDSCTKRSIAARIVRALGYKPSRATSASTTLSVSLQNTYGFDVRIPVGFKFVSISGLVFETTQSTTWSAGVTSAQDVDVSEGETKSVTFVSDGTANQRFKLPVSSDKYITSGSITVVVDSSTWTESDILSAEQTDQYEIEYEEEPTVLRFGDGIAGNIPTVDGEIRVTYRAGSGLLGNITSSQITSTSIPLIVKGTTISLSISQPDAASGGDDPESLESIKANAPKYYSARDVAVTESDYEGLAINFVDGQYGQPAMASAVNTRSYEEDIELRADLTRINNYISDTVSEVNGYVAAVQADIASATSQITSVEDAHDDISDANDTIASTQINVVSLLTAINGYASSINIKANTVSAKADSIISDTAEILTDETLTGGTTNLVNDVTSIATEIKSLVVLINALVGSIQNSSDSVSSEIEVLSDVNEDVTTGLETIDVATTSLTTLIATINTSMTGIESSIDGYSDDISELTDSIAEHINTHWASNTESNIVSVPILAKDGDGFYVAPSNGLIRALQTYLDARKDVTHTINVVSGADDLVELDVTVKVKVSRNYVSTTILSQVDVYVQELLKDNTPGDGLMLQTVYDIKNEIDGIDYLNVTLGPSGYVDGDGNIVVASYETITKGTITVTEVV